MRPEWVHGFPNAVGVRCCRSGLGISVEEFRSAPLTPPPCVERERLFCAVIDETSFDDELVDRILAELDVA